MKVSCVRFDKTKSYKPNEIHLDTVNGDWRKKGYSIHVGCCPRARRHTHTQHVIENVYTIFFCSLASDVHLPTILFLKSAQKWFEVEEFDVESQWFVIRIKSMPKKVNHWRRKRRSMWWCDVCLYECLPRLMSEADKPRISSWKGRNEIEFRWMYSYESLQRAC